MTDTRHTPGPWASEVRTTREHECAPGLWMRSPSGTVFDTGNLAAWPIKPADKALLDAAPELLAALRDVLECVSDSDFTPGSVVLSDARAAIAKATGSA